MGAGVRCWTWVPRPLPWSLPPQYQARAEKKLMRVQGPIPTSHLKPRPPEVGCWAGGHSVHIQRFGRLAFPLAGHTVGHSFMGSHWLGER